MVEEFNMYGDEIPTIPKEPDEIKDLRKELVILYGYMEQMLVKKRKDYGLSYNTSRDEFGPAVFAIRVGDKLNRYKKLMTQSTAQNEPLIDTLYDIIGYATLEILYRQKTKRSDKNDGRND